MYSQVTEALPFLECSPAPQKQRDAEDKPQEEGPKHGRATRMGDVDQNEKAGVTVDVWFGNSLQLLEITRWHVRTEVC